MVSAFEKSITTVATAAILATMVGACGDDAEVVETEVSPFSIAVSVEGATVEDVATTLAEFIDEIDDTTRGLPADWIVAGAGDIGADEDILAASLSLPGGARVIEVCNHHYAEQAMGFGGHHGVALPCEIAVVQNGDDVDVVLLNPEAIFGLFFADIPAEYAAQMSGLAAAVRGELEELVSTGVGDLDATVRNQDVGSSWSESEMLELSGRDNSIVMDVDIPADYLVDADSRQAFRSLFVDTLLETLTYEGMDEVGAKVAGLTVADWRSARPYTLGLPGSVSVVEMCSPTYAAAAMSTGAHHAPALPCQTAIWVDGDILRVHLLDPLFIFPVFFADAPAEMMASMGDMAGAVSSDIQLIVAAAAREVVAD